MLCLKIDIALYNPELSENNTNMTVFVMLCYVLLFQYNLVQYIKFAFMQIMLIYVNVYMYLC